MKGSDLERGKITVLTIQSTESRQIQPDRPSQLILKFHETEKVLPLNMTNLQALINLLGSDTDAWTDREIKVYPTMVNNPTGGKTLGVRIDDRPEQVAAPKNAPVANESIPSEAGTIDPITDDDIPF